MEAVPELRRKPAPWCDPPLPLNALKQADEQSVAAISAVHHALHHYGLDAAAFRDWGVLAAPYYMGRTAVAGGVHRYQSEGAWGASPHLPAHRSLHSPSGTISQLFKFRGPNIGVCGGPGCATEVLAAAAALLDRRRVPGLWVILTAIDPDLPPVDRAGTHAPGTHCAALALALTPPRPATTSGIRLRVIAGARRPRRRRRPNRRPPWTCSALKAFWRRWSARPKSAAPLSSCRWRPAAASKWKRSAEPPSTPTETATARPSALRLLCPLPLAETQR